MPDQAPTPGSATPAAPPSTPASMLATSAMVLLGGWLVFGVLLYSASAPWLSLVAAALILLPRYRPGTPADALAVPAAQYLLALVIVVSGGISLIDSVRGLVSHLNTDITWWAGSAVHYLGVLMTWTAMGKLGR